MRGTVPRLESPHPLGACLPGTLQEDRFAQALTAGLDELLAPLLATLDNLGAYIDPRLAPEDFLQWLAGWLGAAVDETWPLERRRRLVAGAVDLYRRRGTVAGLATHIEVTTGGAVEIAESGGATWSQVSGGALPGEPVPRLAVRVAVEDPSSLSRDDLDALVAAAKPAHVIHHVEVVAR
ncbi:MAG TPA: phage tail protein [Candidatus Dormibacteraeota bacterium]|jgi:phage tail-like protein